MPIILGTQEVEIKRIELRSAMGKMFGSSNSTNSWAWWFKPAIPATVGNINRRIAVQTLSQK
jgi:hypothetical protein